MTFQNEREFLRSYANRPSAAREAFNAAIGYLERGCATREDLDQGIAEALGLTVNHETATDDCDCAAYSLDGWAEMAIDGKKYRRKSGPDIRLAFAMGNGQVLDVRPNYETNAEFIANGMQGV